MAEIVVPPSRFAGESGASDGSGSVFALGIDAREVLPTWTAARALVDRTGRWPVAVCSFDFKLDETSGLASIVDQLNPFFFEQELVGASDPASVIARSRLVDVDAEFARLGIEADWLDDPDPANVPESVPEFNEWYEPRDQLVALLFLPDPIPEHALAYVHWYAGNSSLPSHVLIAVLRRWRETFGAEVVANWGTMLQLVASRRPSTIGEALALARQQELVAPCTTALPGASTEEQAAALLASDRWFLHERP